MNNKPRKYLTLLALLASVGTAHAINLNITDFRFGPAVSVNVQTTGSGPTYNGSAGQFTGTFVNDVPTASARTTMLDAQAQQDSFTAWCAELTQSFSFNTLYTYGEQSGVSYFGAERAADLSRLFTAAQGFVVDNYTSAALQAGIWEIIYEQDPTYGFLTGTMLFSPNDPGAATAFAQVDSWLTSLDRYAAGVGITVLTNADHQNFIVTTPVPEPETWALMLGGLALLGAVQRRSRRLPRR